jgi:outer membrane protein TolC
LTEILVELAEGAGLEGTGYEWRDVERMAERVDAAKAEVEALAVEAEEGHVEVARSIVLTFTDAAAYARVLELLAAAEGVTYADKVERALARSRHLDNA